MAHKPFHLQRRPTTKKNKYIYYVQFYDEAGKRCTAISSGQTSKAAAERWAINRLKKGLLPLNSHLFFGRYASKWWVWARLERLSSHRRSFGSISPGFLAFDHCRRVCAVLCPDPAMRLSCSSFNVLLGRSSCATMSRGTRVPSAKGEQLCAVHTSLPFCSALRWVYSFLTDSPLSSMRWVPCTMRSQMASADGRIPDHLVPAGHRKLRDNNRGCPAIAILKNLKQRQPAGGIQDLEAEIIKDDQGLFLNAAQLLEIAPVGPRQLQMPEELRSWVE